MSLDTFIGLLAAAGLGSIFTVLLQSWLQHRKERNEKVFLERKEAYLGLLQALRDGANQPSSVALPQYLYWQVRCDLVSDSKTRKRIRKLFDPKNSAEDFNSNYEELILLFRESLCIANEK